jgi:hypothetical protein
MPKSSSLTIASFPGQVIEISCPQCGRRTFNTKARLTRVHGDETTIPELIRRLTGDCPVRQTAGHARCGAATRFAGSPPLIPLAAPERRPPIPPRRLHS